MPIREFEETIQIYKDSKKPYDYDTYLSRIAKDLKNQSSPVEAINNKYRLEQYANSLGQVIQAGSVAQVGGALLELQFVDAHKRATCQRVKTIVDHLCEGALRRTTNAEANRGIMDLIRKMALGLGSVPKGK